MQIFFRWSYNPLLVFIVLGAIFVLVYLSYRKVASKKTLALLFTLRALGLLLLVFCISQPVVKFVEKRSEKSYVSLLMDTSKSMGLKDTADGEQRVVKAGKALLSSGIIEKLLSRSEVKCFKFSSSIDECALSEISTIDDVEGDSTDIGRAITSVINELKGQLLSGIIILSDGQNNSGENPVALVRRFRIPVFTVGIGEKGGSKEKDVEIYHISASKRAIVNNLTEVEVTVRNKNFNNKSIPVDLTLGEQVLTSSAITLSAQEPLKKVKLSFAPKKVGRFAYTVKVPFDEEETSSQNNEKSFIMQVTDPGIKVLYVEGTPRWEYKFLKRELQNDTSVEFSSFLRTGPGKLLRQGDAKSTRIPKNPKEISEYDIIIIGDVEKDFFTHGQLEAIKTLVSEGGALIMLGGENSFGAGGYNGTAISQILPVSISADRWVNDEFKLTLTRDGLSHPVFHSLTDDQLPALLGYNVIRSPKPGATILAKNGELIVVAVQNYGQGKSVAITTASTWRWSLSGADRGNFSLFWRQLLRWLHPEEKKVLKKEGLVQIITDRDNYFCGDTIYIKIRALGRTELGDVNCYVNTPDGKKAELKISSGSPGGYTATFTPRKRGIYKINASVSYKDGQIAEDSISLIAGEASLEFINTELNEELLQELSQESGGQYYTTETMRKLPEDIAIPEETITRVHEKKLWHTPWLFTGFIALITLEWIIRKSKQLL